MAESTNVNEQSDREFDLTIKLDERPPGGVSTVELIERAAVIAAEEADRQTAELRAQLAEANETIAHLRKAKNCYYDCVDKAEANQRIATAQEAAMNVVRPLVEQAEARAEAAKQWERDVRRAEEELDKLGAPITREKGGQLNLAGRIRYLFQKAEARAADLARALKVYATESMWVQYKRDGEITASIFIGNENGVEDGVLCDGWRFTQSALRQSEGDEMPACNDSYHLIGSRQSEGE
jgi:hypothetical protein